MTYINNCMELLYTIIEITALVMTGTRIGQRPRAFRSFVQAFGGSLSAVKQGIRRAVKILADQQKVVNVRIASAALPVVEPRAGQACVLAQSIFRNPSLSHDFLQACGKGAEPTASDDWRVVVGQAQ